MKKCVWAAAFAAAAGFACLIQPAQAALIFQGATDNFIAFEAEVGTIVDLDGDGRVWEPIVDAGASGGMALRAPDGADKAINESIVSVDLVFNDPGEYQLFLRYRSETGGTDADSLFIPLASNGISETPPTESEGMTNTSYDWFNTNAEGRYTITPGQVGVPISFSLGVREEEFLVDRVVLWDRNDGRLPFPATLSAFDDLTNSQIPEPATLALFGLGLVGLGLARRRSAA